MIHIHVCLCIQNRWEWMGPSDETTYREIVLTRMQQEKALRCRAWWNKRPIKLATTILSLAFSHLFIIFYFHPIFTSLVSSHFQLYYCSLLPLLTPTYKLSMYNIILLNTLIHINYKNSEKISWIIFFIACLFHINFLYLIFITGNIVR